MAGVALLLVGIAWATAGRALRSKARKFDYLRRLDGQRVRIGLMSGSSKFIIEHTGTLKVGHDRDLVLLEGNNVWPVALDRVQWVADPGTGQRTGHPW